MPFTVDRFHFDTSRTSLEAELDQDPRCLAIRSSAHVGKEAKAVHYLSCKRRPFHRGTAPTLFKPPNAHSGVGAASFLQANAQVKPRNNVPLRASNRKEKSC
jgi:hypothetical protein